MKNNPFKGIAGLFYLVSLIFFLLFFSACAKGMLPAGMPFGKEPAREIPQSDIYFTRESKGLKPIALPTISPVQITFQPDSVLYASVSPDGEAMAYTSGESGSSMLWLGSTDPSKAILPEPLTTDGGPQSSPAFSQDGRQVAFVGKANDVKGDIYIIETGEKETIPRRLTGKDTEDGAPCFSPDGKLIFFHQSRPGETARYLVSIDLKAGESQAETLDTGGDASFPAVSPDGKRIAFISNRDDPKGDLFILTIDTGNITRLTSDPHRDIFPAWSVDGQYLYFSRFALDSDGDNSVTLNDNAVIYRIRVDDDNPRPYPLTSASYSAYQPMPSTSRLYFLSTRKGPSNLWALPLEGEIPLRDTAEAQADFALELEEKLPPDLYLSALAYYKVMESFPKDKGLSAAGAYSIGRLYERLGMPDPAQEIYGTTQELYEAQLPEVLLSTIRMQVLQAKGKYDNALTDSRRQEILKEALSNLREIMDKYPDLPDIRAQCLIESARMLSELGKDSDSLIEATRLLDDLLNEEAEIPGAYRAEALLLRTDIFGLTGTSETLLPSYLKIISEYQVQEEWADLAVERVLNLSYETDSAETENQIQLLMNVADKYTKELPRLAMGAWNRVGDIYFADDEWAQAKAAYRQVIEGFPVIATQTAAARLALAEILYQEERFRQALDLYEKEMTLRTYEDSIYLLAREAYIKKSIASAEYLYRLGEVPSASNIFINLIRDSYSIVEAHRGHIKCAASQGKITPLLEHYQTLLKEDPLDPVTLYAAGLCMTYLNDKEMLKEALSLISRAIERQGQVEYFHQTRGYIFEVLETVYGEKGTLEKALASYQKAYFLNDPVNNPENRSNLLLNMGNVYSRLGQYGKAFENYSERFDTGLPFEQVDTEIQFYRNFGIAAFQSKDMEGPISAFSRALDLIDKRIEPRQASEILGRINSYIVESVLNPALKIPESSEKAQLFAEIQADLNQRLYEVSSKSVEPPPSPSWETYNNRMEDLFSEQEKILEDLQTLDIRDSDNAFQSLYSMLTRARDALSFPSSMIHLKAEMLDRLGLAFQEAEKWQQAGETFEQVYSLNEQLGLFENLAVNQRSIAYNTYMEAGTHSGSDKEKLLKMASEGFQNVKTLLKLHGTTSKTPANRKKALISLAFDIELDETGSTQAMYGFSPEQEERLAETFISRIEMELGNINLSREILKKQLVSYPDENNIPNKDLYGVSLLYHRAGQLDYAMKDPPAAFDHFLRSARLSHQLGNPVSASINILNMALALTRISCESPERDNRLGQLSSLDRETRKLLYRSSDVIGEDVIPLYHNTMGAYYLKLSGDLSSQSIDSAAKKTGLMKDAGTHFSMGLKRMEGEKITNRSLLELLSALHLNMAELALLWGDESEAASHFEKTLETSRLGFFPDHEWRALAGLGRFEEALEVSGSITILRAGCGEGEITNSFALMVSDLVDDGDAEEAFNLVEHLSEIERVNRLAYLFLSEVSQDQLAMARNIYPRLLEIKKIREDLARAGEEEKEFLLRRLSGEEEIQKGEMEGTAELPFLQGDLTGSEEIGELLMIILGVATHMEEMADSAVKAGSGNVSESWTGQYSDLSSAYKQNLKELRAATGKEQAPGMIGILWPEPVEAIDVMESLPENSACIRFYHLPWPEGGWISFIITPDEIRSEKFISPDDLHLPQVETILPAYENLSAFPVHINGPAALSATHLVRSFENRKPFKSNLLALPHKDSLPEGFISRSLQEGATDDEILEMLPEAHTIILNKRIDDHSSVPARSGESPKHYMAMELEKDRVFSLSRMSNRVFNTSLVLLPGASMRDAYTLGHLFSLWGVPTIILPNSPKEETPFIDRFLKSYGTSSIVESLQAVSNSSGLKEVWIQLGFRGMETQEALKFAKENFSRYVKEGIESYKDERHIEALSYFENALNVASEVEKLRRYLPNLFTYARESAYMADRNERAVKYAQGLADILVQENPYSEEHAKALLKLGLVLAGSEQYEDAIPVLEEALNIMENLELGPEQVAALSDLGVVLENATEFDRAIVRFQSAASLSKALDKKELLAGQYLNIGRIYDLRMNMYAMAKQNYQEAHDIYQELDDPDGVAQALLDMGRCYRLLGNFMEADEHYKKALELTESGEKNPRLRARIRIEQANNAWYQARYQEAFDIRTEVSDLARQNNWTLEQVMAFNTAGLTWWTLGDYDRALRDLGEALSLAESLKIRRDEVATTLNNIGLVYRDMGKYDDALETLDKALEIDRALGSRWAIAYDLRNKALTHLRMGEPEKAPPLLREALEAARDIGNKINEAKILLALGETAIILDNNDESQEAYSDALNLARSMSLRETEWRALFGLSKLLLKENRKDEARDTLAEAIKVIEGMRAEIKIDQLKDGFIDNKMSVYETMVSLLVDMGEAEEAFNFAERSRARNLIDLLGNQRLNLKGAVDQEMYDRQRRLRAEIDEQEALLAQSVKESERVVYGNALARLNDEYDDLLLKIQAENPELASLVSIDPLALSDLKALLNPEVVLLAFYVVPDEILCWLVSRDSVKLFRTPVKREILDQEILAYRRMIQNLEPLGNRSEDLYDIILSKIFPRAGSLSNRGPESENSIKTIGIVPHGSLHYLSFATLFDGESYMADRYPIFYLPSTSVLQYTIHRRDNVKERRVLAIGNPDLQDPGMDLPFAEHEVSSIGWNFPNITVLTREKATESWLVGNINEFGIIHLASHGEFDPINPLFSNVRLVKDISRDGNLEASEVFGLEINADLVVLSACQSGLGKVTGGDDVIGMNRSFLYGGTHAILSTLWRVSDISTAILVKQFYRKYVAENKADSLRQAMLHVKNRYPHPGYWGAFVLVGDYY